MSANQIGFVMQQPGAGGAPSYPQYPTGPGPMPYPAPGGAPGYPPAGPPGYPPAGGPPYQQPAGQPYGQPPPGAMPPPQQHMAVPRGLEYLTAIDQLLIQQKVEIGEIALGLETANKYTIKNSVGQKVYKAKEDNDICTRQCCGPVRPFNMKIKDNNDVEVINLDRPLRCQASCCWCCCLQTLEVNSPTDGLLGTVDESWSLLRPCYTIRNSAGDAVLNIEGPIMVCRCYSDVEFQIYAASSGQKVGKITKQWGGLLREAYTDADNFGVTFPMDLDVKVKAVLLGAVFLIDFMYFEQKAKR